MTEFVDTLPSPVLWMIFAATALLVVLLIVALVVRLRRRKSIAHLLEGISYDLLSQIVVPKPDDGEIQIEYTLLTGRGVLVIETKDVDGVVFASDRMDDWAVIAGDRRYTFANPQPTLYDRIAAVAQIVGEVPVEGVVLFPGTADFSKGSPRHVTTLESLLAEYPRVERSRNRSAVAAFLPYWDRLRQEAVSVRVGRLAD